MLAARAAAGTLPINVERYLMLRSGTIALLLLVAALLLLRLPPVRQTLAPARRRLKAGLAPRPPAPLDDK